MTAPAPFASNAEHLVAELGHLDLLLSGEMIRFRQGGEDRKDPFRAAYVSEPEVERLLGGASAGGDARARTLAQDGEVLRTEIDARLPVPAEGGGTMSLPRLTRVFGLTPFEQQVIVIALAPEIDLKYERIFAFLQDDLARRRPSLDLALRLLCPTPEARLRAMALLAPAAPLFRSGLLTAPQGEGPWLASPLALDELTLRFLLQDSVLNGDPARSGRRGPPAPPLEALRWPRPLKDRLVALVTEHARAAAEQRLLCRFSGPPGTGRKTLAAALCAELAIPLAFVDLRAVLRDPAQAASNLARVFRQGLLTQSALFFEHFELVAEDESGTLRELFARTLDELGWLAFVATEQSVPSLAPPDGYACVEVALPAPDIGGRERVWESLKQAELFAPDVACGELAAKFRLTPGAILAAVRAAQAAARLREAGARPGPDDLVRGCYVQSSRKLAALGRKLPARHAWDDLVLPPRPLAQLSEICAQLRHRGRVYGDWGFDRAHAWGKGLCVLFYGPSGVGKTMAADVIARELGLDAYRIDLSAVVSKYIGETEKNLGKVFDEAESSNAMLFFDEADALFSRRSEVKDAHDRYANIESNYLLQRMEEFEGLVVLASNLRKNIDDGFFRRMQFAVDFPFPDVGQRYQIWRRHLPSPAPLAGDVDLAFLADRFAIAGGNIKNIVINAAFLAANDGGDIGMAHLIRATRREFEKLGRPCTEAEFAPYHEHIRSA